MSDLAKQRDLARRLGRTEAGERPLATGSAFPSSPPTGFLFFRTDLGFLCYYDGTRWLTVQEYAAVFGAGDTAYAVTVTASQSSLRMVTVRNDYALYFTQASTALYATTNSGSHYFTYTFRRDGSSALWTFNTSGDGTGELYKTTASITQPLAALTYLYLDVTATGSPSHNVRTPVFYYRLIIT